jgi:hypothetical protein
MWPDCSFLNPLKIIESLPATVGSHMHIKFKLVPDPKLGVLGSGGAERSPQGLSRRALEVVLGSDVPFNLQP